MFYEIEEETGDHTMPTPLGPDYNTSLKNAILLIKNASMSHAKEWNETSEKWIYCEEYLDLSADFPGVDGLVEALETRFESMLTLNS